MSDGSSSPSRNERSGLFDRLRSIFAAPHTSVREDIEDALEESTEGDLSAQERSMLRSVLGLHELRVRDVMVPRADITAVATTDSLAHILKLFRTAGHSRLPVYKDSLDAPQGMVHIRDFLELLARLYEKGVADGVVGHAAIDLSAPLPAHDVMREVLFVPPSMPVLDLLVRMQAERTHMALVIDEYGGTDGLVSIEDVMEVIVGDIEDEHDIDETPRIEKLAEDEYVIDGRAQLEQAIVATGVDLRLSDDAEDIETVGGLVATIAGHIPEKGEHVDLSLHWRFEVLDTDQRRVTRVRLIRKAEPTGEDAPA